MAFLRAVVAGEKNLAVSCEDDFAELFLGRKYRLLTAIGSHRVHQTFHGCCRAGQLRLYDRAYAALRRSLIAGKPRRHRAAGGALARGTIRGLRFRDLLRGISIFEIDHPATQARKQQMLERAGKARPAEPVLPPGRFQ